jgi:hypothetical protein
MNFAESMTLWVGGLAIVGLAAYVIHYHLSPEARERRRCRRNHRKVISRVRRPQVMLNAKVPRT